MSANYLHGVETVELDIGARPVSTVKTAIIGLIGTAPVWQVDEDGNVNELMLVTNYVNVKKFGSITEGYTIPYALDAIFDQGGAEVVVINVFDPAEHKTAVIAESVTFNTQNTAQLAHEGVQGVVVKSSDGLTTYVAGTDYNVDAYGKLTRLGGGAIAQGATVKVDYDYADPTKVTNADIIGGIDGVTGNYRGLKLFLQSFARFGAFPKLLIAPGFCSQLAIATEMIPIAEDLKAIALVDAPVGATYQQAIEGRGETGEINFYTSSERVVLCYPHVKIYDTDTGETILEGLSARLAGVIANKDKKRGYWWSPSNTEIRGIIGVERLLTARVNEPDSEVNRLNEAGITTVFNSYGTGWRVWGNRTAAWPTVTHPKNFINIRRAADILYESIEYAMLQFLDRPINNALVDNILNTVNGYMRTMIARGAFIDGKCWFDEAKNPDTEIALGHLTFDVDFMPPPPAERISFDAFIDIELLKQITGGK